MAIFLPILGSLSGSIGDVTFSHNRGGPYARRRSIPVNPNTSKQQLARQHMSLASQEWQSLTQAQRQTWTDWAALNPIVNALGQSIQLSGEAAYVSLSSRLIAVGTGSSVTPPVVPAPAALLSVTVAASVPDTLTVTWTPTPLGATERIAIWSSLPGSPGRSPNIRQCRLVAYGAAADASPTAFVTPYNGVATQKSVSYVGVIDDATGLQSQLLRAVSTWV